MVWMWAILGAIFGSAGNALIYRLPRSLSWVNGRSKCPHCSHLLEWNDLIPVVSYVLLGGRCRYCHSPIPPWYLVVELVTALGFAVIGSMWGMYGIPLMLVWWATVVTVIIDWQTKQISLAIVGVMAIALLMFQWMLGYSDWGSSAMGLSVGAGAVALIWGLTKGNAMGDGDIYLAGVMGWWLGWPITGIGLWIAFVSGAMWGLYLLLAKKATRKTAMPFGPFLMVGMWVGYTFGNDILKWLL